MPEYNTGTFRQNQFDLGISLLESDLFIDLFLQDAREPPDCGKYRNMM